MYSYSLCEVLHKLLREIKQCSYLSCLFNLKSCESSSISGGARDRNLKLPDRNSPKFWRNTAVEFKIYVCIFTFLLQLICLQAIISFTLPIYSTVPLRTEIPQNATETSSALSADHNLTITVPVSYTHLTLPTSDLV